MPDTTPKEQLTPVKTWHTNRYYLGNNGVEPLPVTMHQAQNQTTINSVWTLSFWQRLRLLFTGVLTLRVAGTQQPPVILLTGDVFGPEPVSQKIVQNSDGPIEPAVKTGSVANAPGGH